MRKITALLTTLALGASTSVAMASSSHPLDHQPGIERSRVQDTRVDRDHERGHVQYTRVDRDRDGRADRPDEPSWGRAGDDFGPRRYRPTWTALGAPVQLTRTGADCIVVNDRGTFTQLRVQTLGRAARIDRVVVRFADGTNQVTELDRVLDDRGELLEIPLDGNNRRIDRVTVIGASAAHGDIQVFGI